MFFKKNKIKDQELENAFQKLKEKYIIFSEKYGKNNFNLDKLYDRFHNSLTENIDFKIFITAEILAFQDKKKQIEEELILKNKKKEKSKIQEIYDRYNQKIQKYKRLKIANNANEEIERLYGCFVDIYNKYFNILTKINRATFNSNLKKNFIELEGSFYSFCIKKVNSLPTIFEDYKILIKRYSNDLDNMEKAGYEVLKKSYNFLSYLRSYIDILKIEKNNFKNITFDFNDTKIEYTEILDIFLKEIEDILIDFRLKNFDYS